MNVICSCPTPLILPPIISYCKQQPLCISVLHCLLFCYRNIEEILAEKGETITKLKSDDIIELVAKDLTDGTKCD